MLTITMTPWPKIIRHGIPQFKVVRRPITVQGVTAEIGDPIPVALTVNRARLRQLYEQRLIAPVESVEGVQGNVEPTSTSSPSSSPSPSSPQSPKSYRPSRRSIQS